MMDFAGNGMLALWNGVDPERRDEYHLWHTREHVPERILVPGMLGARRYVRIDGPLPELLTLYAMRDTEVLTSEPYRNLLASPTPWSRSMRPSFRGFMRICCRREWSAGGGMGGVLAASMFQAGADVEAAGLRAALAELLALPCITAAHLLVRDASAPDVPFSIGGAEPDFPRAGAILLEGYGEATMADGAAAPAFLSARFGLASVEETFTRYRLAYALDRESLDRLVPISAPAR